MTRVQSKVGTRPSAGSRKGVQPAFVSVRPLTLAVHLACGAFLSGGILIAPAVQAQDAGQAVPTAAQGEAALPAVTVSAQPIQADDTPAPFAGGQVGSGARLGILGNVDVMDAPFNVTGYTSQLIENQQARTLADVVMNDPSVRFTTSSGHAYENFRIRGFDVNQNDVAINGMFGMLPLGHVPLEFVERVEVLKGPNALFSGMAPSGAVGGVINLAPKRAGDEALTRASVGFQSQGQLGTSIDLGRRFGEDKEWGLRVNGAFSNGETGIDGQSKKREFLSAALDYRGRSLKASLDAYASKESYKGGTSSMFWLTSTAIPAAPDPSLNQFPAARGDLESKAVIARAEYEINSQLSAFAGIGVMHNDYSGFINGTHVRNINALGTSTTTITSSQRGNNENVAAEAGMRANFNTGKVRHEMVLQASNLNQESSSASTTSAPFTTNIYNPVYQALPTPPALVPKTSESTLSSLALVDTMSFLDDDLRLTLGLRHQTVKTTNFNPAGAVTGDYDKSAVTPAVGVVFKPWGPGVSLYANYVQGLSKGDSVSTPTYAYNYTFAPYKTEQKEVGVKWNAGGFANTFSLFEITKPMLIALTGGIPSDDGEKRVRGLEWNTFGELARNVRLLGGASYNQGVQTKTANGQFDGKTAVGTPRWQGNLGAEWDTPWVAGLSLNARVVANSSQYLNSANTQKLPGWADVEIGGRYTTQVAGRKLVLRLNVGNLFDRHYYSGVFSDTTPIATLGLGRTVTTSATMDF